MNSFISHSKPFIIAFAAIFAIESTIFLVFKPRRIQRSNFLNYSFSKEDSFQRLVLHDKVQGFKENDYDIIQVGDSSGLHGVIPPVIEANNPGYKYVNMSVATNLGYNGYLNVADYMLRRNPNARYLVVYVSPVGGMPRKDLWDQRQSFIFNQTRFESMSPHIYRELLSPFHNIFLMPSQIFRKSFVDPVFYFVPYQLAGAKLDPNRPASQNRGYLMFDDSFRQTRGWARETDNEGDVDRDLYQNMAIIPEMDIEYMQGLFDVQRRSYVDVVLAAVDKLARKHNVKVIFIFNPVPNGLRHGGWTKKIKVDKLLHAFRASASKYDTLIIPKGFDWWPDSMFSAFSHIKGPHALDNSLRVSQILSTMLPARTPKSSNVNKSLPVSIQADDTFSGYAWPPGQSQSAGLRPIPQRPAFVFRQLSPATDYIMELSIAGDNMTHAVDIYASANGRRLDLLQRQDASKVVVLTARVGKSMLRESGGFLNLSLKSLKSDMNPQFSSIRLLPQNPQ